MSFARRSLASLAVLFPAPGRLRADGKGYRWVPVDYSANN